MKFTLSWLKDFLETDASLSDISDKLNNIGLEVESIHDPDAKLGAFTVGRIVKAEKHPDADRLKVCTVATKDGELQIICGAPNARADINICLSVPGMYIPGLDITLKKGKIRGIESCGMLCSYEELGLEGDNTGIIELPEAAKIGDKVIDVLGINDPLIEISITPNRPDALGVYGIARDLAAAGLGKLKTVHIPDYKGAFKSPISVTVQHPESCPHFVGAYISGVKNVKAPDWMVKRLAAVGCSSHSALVDITNYMSYSFARPLHVFDADKIGKNISARLAKPDEEIVSLKDISYHLEDRDIVIADEEKPHAIAGIMGGLESGCSDGTVNVFLESAYFDPHYIAMTGRRVNILSDARYRFERGIDPAFTQDGAILAIKMILELCGGEASELVIAGEARKPDEAFSLTQSDVKNITGVDITWERQKDILTSLGFQIIDQGQKIIAIPPSYRPDILGNADLIEEIIRIYGIDEVPSLMLPKREMTKAVMNDSQKRLDELRSAAVRRGLNEVISYSFISEEHAKHFGGGAPALHLSNPIAKQLSDMRPSLLPGLLTAANKNAAHGMKNLKFFEIGRVFEGLTEELQPYRLAILRTGRNFDKHWADAGRDYDLFDAKADAIALLKTAGAPVSGLQTHRQAPDYYHPGRSGALMLGKTIYAYFGELHPKTIEAFDVSGPAMACEILLDHVPLPKPKKTTALPTLKTHNLQAISRDFAFVMDRNIDAETLLRSVKKADKKLIEDAFIFDIYEGEHLEAGQKSVALKVVIQPDDKTLTDEEIENLSHLVIENVSKATGAHLRG